VESGRPLMESGSKCDERSRLAVIRWFLVKKVLLKQNVPEKGIGGL